MLFRVPLAYDVKGIPKGKRNETNEQFWEYIEVDIPLLTDEAAPVAVTWDDRYPAQSMWMKHEDDWRNAQSIPEDGMQVMRMKEGEFYLRRHDALTPELLSEKLTPKGDFRIFGQSFIHYENHDREHPLDMTLYRQDKPFSSTFDDQIAKVRKAAEDFFIVGNDIYQLSSEPVVIKVSYNTENGGGVAPRVIPSHKVKASAAIYRIDKYAEVVAELDELSRRFRDAPRVTMERAPKVHLAQAIGFNDLFVNLVNAARTHVEKQSDHTRLNSVDPDSGIAYLRLKKALTTYDNTGDINDLEDAAANIVQNCPEDVRYGNLASSYRAYADRPVDTLTVGAWRQKR
ncbi:hypothetical protein OIU34_21825 [Pararhizobium sp. BT-229]|uniref:hypothetical protein n=1 Tax=Pararhizobium sp. BT-229 TaxID=2986923 RepID=UPI0021F75117|nr:hypothetical protein [Pararhizobium sp. BT-229]MCV9964533.1 hypothetical protein [Pararhizobium sp. BT-229]